MRHLPPLQGYCQKCDKVINLVNITGITDSEYMQITGYCPNHTDKPLKMTGKKTMYSKYNIKIVGEEVFNEKLHEVKKDE